MLSESVSLQLMAGIERFNGEILPCEPQSCGSDEENAVRAKRRKGEGPAFVVHPSPPFKEFSGVREGARD